MLNLAFEAANGGVSLGSIILSGWVDEQNTAYLLCANPDILAVITANPNIASALPSNISPTLPACSTGPQTIFNLTGSFEIPALTLGGQVVAVQALSTNFLAAFMQTPTSYYSALALADFFSSAINIPNAGGEAFGSKGIIHFGTQP